MRAIKTGTAEFTPLFDWSPPRGRKLSLISFIAASVALHAFCFYVFQIIYPPTVALLPPPARVNLITSDTEDGRVLLRWVESEDPALSSTTQRAPDATAFEPPVPAHVPSYFDRQPALKEAPPYHADLGIPSSRPPGPVPLPRAPAAAATTIAAKTPTTLKFSGDLERLGTPTIPSLRFSASTKEPPRVARFRVGISSRGDVRYCFLQESSGDSALDGQARGVVMRCRFAPTEIRESTIENYLTWATAEIEWGNDPASSPDPSSSHAP